MATDIFRRSLALASLAIVSLALASLAWGQSVQKPWFDGQQQQNAWVDSSGGAVALSADTPAKPLKGAFTIVTQPDQAKRVLSSLQDMGLNAQTRSFVANRVYVYVPAELVLATTMKLQDVDGVEAIRLQWASPIAAPTLPQ